MQGVTRVTAPVRSGSALNFLSVHSEPELLLTFEAAVTGELEGHYRKDDIRRLHTRRLRLLAMFRGLVSPHRERLLDRLIKPKAGDRLAALFVGRLSEPTRETLLEALRGEAVAMPRKPDEDMTTFLDGLGPESLLMTPDPPVIGPWMAQVEVTVTPVSAAETPALASPLDQVWTLFDAQDIEIT
jgi:hypothetical protein